MAGFRLTGFKPNIRGIDQVLSSEPVRERLREYAEEVAERANANAQDPEAHYEAHVDQATYVSLGKVVAGNAAAKRDNALNNTILKSR